MAFAPSQPGYSLEPGFRQGKTLQPRPVLSHHPARIARERPFDWWDLALIGLGAAITALVLLDGVLILLY